MLIIEQKGAWLVFRNGYVDAIAHEPQECTYCHRMTVFFENRNGETRCTGCEGPRKETI